MRGIITAVVVVVVVTAVPMATPAVASHYESSSGVRTTEVYRASLPLTKRSHATITVEHFTRASTTSAEANAFYACLTVQGPLRTVRTSSGPYTYRPFYSSCDYIDVMRYEFDIDMKRMRLQFDMPGHYGSLPPASVDLVITGSGPVRNRTPTFGTHDEYGATRPWATVYSSRRAVTKGRITGPGVGSHGVRRHSPRRGVLERRTTTVQYVYLPRGVAAR